MKKRNRLLVLNLLLLVFFTTLVTTGCQTKAIASFKPIEALSMNNSLFINIPVKGNEELVSSLIKKQIPALSGSSIQSIIERIVEVYIAVPKDLVDSNLLFGSYQIVAVGSFPRIVENTVFSTKNAWIKQRKNDSAYRIYTNSLGPQAVVVNPSTMFLSDNVQEMLDNIAIVSEVNGTVDSAIDTANINEIESYLQSDNQTASDQINFYIKDAEYLVKSFLQGTMSLAIESIYGNFKPIKNLSGNTEYEATFTLSTKTPLVTKSLKLLINIATKAKGYSVAIKDINETEIEVSNLLLPIDTIIRLMEPK